MNKLKTNVNPRIARHVGVKATTWMQHRHSKHTASTSIFSLIGPLGWRVVCCFESEKARTVGVQEQQALCVFYLRRKLQAQQHQQIEV